MNRLINVTIKLFIINLNKEPNLMVLYLCLNLHPQKLLTTYYSI